MNVLLKAFRVIYEWRYRCATQIVRTTHQVKRKRTKIKNKIIHWKRNQKFRNRQICFECVCATAADETEPKCKRRGPASVASHVQRRFYIYLLLRSCTFLCGGRFGLFFFLFVWRFSGALSIYLFLIRCIFLSFYIWWHHTNIDGGDKRIWQPLVGKCTEHHCGKIDRIISNAADAANDGGSVCFTKPAFTEITDSLTHINPLRAFLKSTILDLVWYTENLLKGSTKRLW